MGANTKIQWTDKTWNPWWGCVKVSPACANCYAAGIDSREQHKDWYQQGRHWGKNAPRHTWPHDSDHWREPADWNKEAERKGIRFRTFCLSMGDVMEDRPDLTAERTKLYEVIEQTPYLDWLLLTKRPQNYRRFFPSAWIIEPRKNVWLMTTVESQEHIWRIDEMRKVPAVVYGVSAEPLLGPITLPQKFLDLGETGWLITGGESGPKSRTKNDGAWHWDLMRQCDPAGVPFFFKQHGTYIGMERLTKVLAEVMKNKTFETKEEEKAAKKVEKARLEHMFFDGKVYQNFPVIRYR